MSTSASPPSANYDVNHEHSQGPPRKKMRKGTRSCIECRRRKIKCTFEPGRSSVCNECHQRGSTCIDQEHGDTSVFSTSTASVTEQNTTLKERVNYLEDLVKQVLNRLPEKGGDKTPQATAATAAAATSMVNDDAQAAEVLESLRGPLRTSTTLDESYLIPPDAGKTDGTALSLFDNAVIERKQVPPTISRAQYNKSKTVIAALLQLLPSPDDLELILENSQEWWTIWKTMFPNITDPRCVTIKESISHSLRSEKPAEIAKIMLCIALSVNQLPQDFDWKKLSIKEPPAEIMERYVATVDRLVTSDDEIAATIDGIECMILEAKYHINLGRPRRSWLLYHRAVAFGQLLGLHRISLRRPATPDMQYVRQLMIWTHLIMGDRYLSLVLGLPYSVAESFVGTSIAEAANSCKDSAPGEAYLARTAPLITKLIDRNQSPKQVSYQVTLSLDAELDDLYRSTDPAWWSYERLPNATVEEHYDRMQAQFFHYHVKVLMHMPFMLRSSADRRYQYSHNAALDGARMMIRYFQALRGDDEIGPHSCKLVDFQAFTAAMLLLLNLCGYNSHARGAVLQQPDLDQDQQDSVLIDLTITLLKKASAEPGGHVALQCASALETLGNARQGPCAEAMAKAEDKCANATMQISIPYFGAITIGIGKKFVPIKPGTYPEAGTARTSVSGPVGKTQQQQQQQQQNGMLPPVYGLPTPPSVSSSNSQPSPNLGVMSQQHSPYGTPLTAPASGSLQVDNTWSSTPTRDDPFVIFDSFMAFPGASSIDYSDINIDFNNRPNDATNTNMNGGYPNTAMPSVSAPDNVYGGPGMTIQEQNLANGFPFPMASGAGLELDNGWEWFGLDAPVL